MAPKLQSSLQCRAAFRVKDNTQGSRWLPLCSVGTKKINLINWYLCHSLGWPHVTGQIWSKLQSADSQAQGAYSTSQGSPLTSLRTLPGAESDCTPAPWATAAAPFPRLVKYQSSCGNSMAVELSYILFVCDRFFLRPG